ncbi:type II toxin-antitoxin system HP0895 family antitoxin [Helicobacter pylori]|uniref:type II toxin-antitoxin system HP0895 family antitoxin n=1 Tax=Helicobacter pylori TaxID=210 RepID=UPI003466A6EA
MPNTTAKKDYTQYSEKQLFNLIHQLERKIKKMQNDRVSFKEKMAKELEKRDQNFKDKIDALNELLQKISQAFDDKRDCCLGRKIPNIQTQQAMRDALSGVNLTQIDSLDDLTNELKRENGKGFENVCFSV